MRSQDQIRLPDEELVMKKLRIFLASLILGRMRFNSDFAMSDLIMANENAQRIAALEAEAAAQAVALANPAGALGQLNV